MNNLIKEAQAQHDADETWYAYRDSAWLGGYPRSTQHKNRGDLLAVIKAIGELASRLEKINHKAEWNGDSDTYDAAHGLVEGYKDAAYELQVLLNGEAR